MKWTAEECDIPKNRILGLDVNWLSNTQSHTSALGARNIQGVRVVCNQGHQIISHTHVKNVTSFSLHCNFPEKKRDLIILQLISSSAALG